MVKIHESKCIKCLKCVKECPCKCISERENIYIEHEYCMECGHCYAVCPVEAVSMDGKAFVPYSELTDIIASRRSCRKYTSESISDEDMAKLVQIANHVPSATNQKQVELVVVRDKNMLDSVKELTQNTLLKNFAILDNPLMVLPAKIMMGKYYGKIKRTKGLMTPAFEAGEDVLLFDAPCFVAVHMSKKAHMPDEDSHYAAYNMILLAEEMGLGSCFMGFARRALNTKEGKALLGIPESHEIYTCFVLGHPDTEYLRNIPQKEIKVKYFG